MNTKDKNVAAVIIYIKDSDPSHYDYAGAYMDKACSKLFSEADLLDAYLKGAVVNDVSTGTYMTPYLCKPSDATLSAGHYILNCYSASGVSIAVTSYGDIPIWANARYSR